MERFEFVDHTADAEFFAYGKTREEAFANAALAVTSIVVEGVEPKTSRQLVISGKDEKELLYRLLDEVVFLIDAEDFVISRFEGMRIATDEGAWRLDTTVWGDVAQRYELLKAVKKVLADPGQSEKK